MIGSNTSSNIASDSKTFALSFAAKIGSDKPADVYQNEVIVSVVSAPGQVALFGGIQTMQQMTSSICEAADIGDEAQLRDMRDGKMYWVSKLADSRCWMTQNLDLNLSIQRYLSPSNSDVSEDWTPPRSAATTADSSSISVDDTGVYSWDLGDYRIKDPIIPNSCGSAKNAFSQCADQFIAYTTPKTVDGEVNAHYIVGNHYQWNAATAGTGGTISSGQASSSICPKGWRLPTSTPSGEFQALLNAYSIESDVAKLTDSPLYFVRGGSVVQSTLFLLNDAGSSAGYWSSTPLANGTQTYSLDFGGTDYINASGVNYRQDGRSVRCIAK